MLIDNPNQYNEEAFEKGKLYFSEGKGLIANPYPKTQESDFYDWRIGWNIAKWEEEIKKKGNNDT